MYGTCGRTDNKADFDFDFEVPQGNFWGGGRKGSGCGGRAEGTEAKAPKTTCHGLQSSQLRHGLQSSQLRHGLRCLFRSGGPRPVFLSVFVLRGLQSAHPPSLVELLRRGTRLPGGGSYVRVLLCVCHVFPPLVSIFGLFPVLVWCHYELTLVQLCLSRYL